jgi:hypothetical protein
LRNGDRIGHALALGTDIRKYYQRRDYTLCITKQVLLDNIVWLHHKCISIDGYSQLCGYFEELFRLYYRIIFIGEKKVKPHVTDKTIVSIHDYYHSWLLRGDDPACHIKRTIFQKRSSREMKEWNSKSQNHLPEIENARNNEKAVDILKRYNCFDVINRGNQSETFYIKPEYRESFFSLLGKIQQQLLDRIENEHIAIECNPTSNYKIGEMERYDEHPILKFFNYGLNTEYPRHDISVSINTDDKGIFVTSLEREYSLMALSLELHQKEGQHNSPRAIVEWLDRIREMGMEQRFGQEL